MKRIFAFLAMAAVLLCASAQRPAQKPAPMVAPIEAAQTEAARPAPRVALVIADEGAEPYQLEGHAGLQLSDPAQGIDAVVNWGVFDYYSPGFAWRFVLGRTDYLAAPYSERDFLYDYRRSGRGVRRYWLNLTREEEDEVIRLVRENLLPQNRVYRYNYVLDNCATRPLAIVERAAAASGESLAYPADTLPATFRSEMRRYHRNYPAYQAFVDLALGPGVDTVIDTRARAFAPLYLAQLLGETTIGGRPLVASEETLLGRRAPEPREALPNPWWVVGTLAVVTALLTWRDERRGRPTRWFDALLFLFVGLIGCVSAFLVFVSVHEATSPNFNLLWANPLALTVPLLVWWRRTRPAVRCYHWVNLLLVGTWMLGQPLWPQQTNALFLILACCTFTRSLNALLLAPRGSRAERPSSPSGRPQ